MFFGLTQQVPFQALNNYHELLRPTSEMPEQPQTTAKSRQPEESHRTTQKKQKFQPSTFQNQHTTIRLSFQPRDQDPQ